MLRLKLVLISTLLGISLLAFGANPWDQGSVPVQVFRQASDLVAVDKSSAEATPIKKSEQPTTPVLKTLPPVSNMPVKITSPASGLDKSANQQLLETEINEVNQNNIIFQQVTNTRLDDLTSQVQLLQKQLQQLNQAMLLLNQQMDQLSHIAAATPHRSAFLTYFAQYGLPDYAIAIAVIVLLMILFSFFWQRKRPPLRAKIMPEDSKDTESEYDYLGSVESIPAKLNLARAYIAMENYTQARLVLLEIIAQGNPLQRKEAEKLLYATPAEGT